MTQKQKAERGEVTPQMIKVAKKEDLKEEVILQGLREGTIVIPKNNRHKISNLCGIGKGLSIKVNANIGTSLDYKDLDEEVEKLEVAVKSGADTVMDLSTGGNLDTVRRLLIKKSSIPLGTVPIYQAAIEAKEKYGVITKMKEEEIFEVIERQAKDGVDFVTVHCGVTKGALECLKKERRSTGIVSRGGAILACWMLKNEKENPLYENFEQLLKIAQKYDLTLSLGDGLRPGSLADATDRPQIEELIVLGGLVERARAAGVQVMVEGPGHIPLDQIETNVRIEKEICKGAPFYVLGPLVTDIAAGYDHITGAIGGALAGMYGADFLCYVTPSEHLGLPDKDDVREGVIATKIAAHSADLTRGIKSSQQWDKKMGEARGRLNWERQLKLSLAPEKAKKYRKERKSKFSDVCSMCGEYCAMKMMKDI